MKSAKKHKNYLSNIRDDVLLEIPNLITNDVINNPILPITKFAQGLLTRQIARFISEYQAKINEGQVKKQEDLSEEMNRSLFEILKFFISDIPAEAKFNAAKSIFFHSASINSSSAEEGLCFEFLQTIKKISGTEVLILKANYQISKGNVSPLISQGALDNGKNHRSTWRKVIAKQMGYGEMESIVTKYEENLESLGLISQRHEMDRLQSQFEQTRDFRLTEMGSKFCEYIFKYDENNIGTTR